MLTVLIISTILQFIAAGLAFALIRKTGRIFAWLAMSSAFLLMGIRRSVTLVHILTSDAIIIDPSAEGLALLISCLMVTGVLSISGVFNRLNSLHAATERELKRRIAAEEAMSVSQKRFEDIALSSGDWIWECDASGRYTFASGRLEQITGYTPDEILGMTPFELMPEEEAKRVGEVFEKVAARKESIVELENMFRSKDGRILHLLTSGVPVLDENGDLAGYRGVDRDITEKKQAEAKFVKQREMFELVINSAPINIFWKDVNSVYVGCNTMFVRSAGKNDIEDIIGKNDSDLVWSGEDQKYLDDDREVLKTGLPKLRYKEHYTLPDSTTIWWQTSKIPLRDHEGKILGLLGISEDITERKQAEDRLRYQDMLLQDMGKIAHIGAWELDPDTGEGTWTDEAARIHDLDPEDATNMEKGLSFYEGESRVKIELAVKEAIESREPYDLELELVSARNVRKWVRVIGSPIVENGKVTRLRGSIQDITKQRSLENQLRQAQKMESVGRLAGGIAHDFNNMLTVIIGYAELAMDNLEPDEPFFEDLKEIYRAAERSADIVRQLLAFARKQTITPKVLDLNDCIENMLKMLRRLIGEDIDISWLPKTDVLPVKMDPSQLDQILANLCVNARDAMKGTGKLTIETENVVFDEAYCANHVGFVPGRFVMIVVSDNGEGMTPEVMKTIFEPFFTTKGPHRGTGLGLSTVYGIVKQNNGFINVYSEPGEGTTFRIYLPRHEGTDVKEDGEVSQESIWSQGETVLLVEDDASILKLGERMLKNLGYHVLIANTIREAIELSQKHADDINLMITDVVMPEMNGHELSEQIKERCPDLKVLFMSGYTENVIAHSGVLEQGVQFISKPFSIEDLAKKIRETLDNA